MCLHGFLDTWRTWQLVLPALERCHDVLAPTLAGHAGGPPIEGKISDTVLADAVERAMDEAGFQTAHLVGNSLGGYVALQLAARGRAETVVALAPAGGWAQGDDSYRETLGLQAAMLDMLKAAAPHADALLATSEGRRRATQLITTNFEHIPAELLAHLMVGAAASPAGPALNTGAGLAAPGRRAPPWPSALQCGRACGGLSELAATYAVNPDRTRVFRRSTAICAVN